MQGFKKRVAIKRVLPHLAQNESFIEMFLDEARLSARLNHANIVSVFDISKREDTYFLIMEFVDGANLKRVIETLTKRGQRMRLGEAIFLCIEACRGLSYAHELADEGGNPLGIVHRDISPPNIMVTKPRRGEGRRLRPRQGQHADPDHRPRRGEGQVQLPVARRPRSAKRSTRADIFALGVHQEFPWRRFAGSITRLDQGALFGVKTGIRNIYS